MISTARSPLRVLAASLTLAAALSFPTGTFAHHLAAGADASGVSIPSLTHDQMAVVEEYRSAVLTLADGQNGTDLTFRRLRNFIALQHAFCLWGMMPGSGGDEASARTPSSPLFAPCFST